MDSIAGSTKLTCSQIRDVFTKMRGLREEEESSPSSETVPLRRRGVVLLSYLKKLNRLSHLYCKDSKEQTHEVTASLYCVEFKHMKLLCALASSPRPLKMGLVSTACACANL